MKTQIACPDCSATTESRNLAHDPTCPFGLALDRVTDADRDWFAAHPNATVRHRPVVAAEKIEHGIFGFDGIEHTTHVQVIQISPGLRLRHPYVRNGCSCHGPYSPEDVESLIAELRGDSNG